jgi:hypothetical protein
LSSKKQDILSLLTEKMGFSSLPEKKEIDETPSTISVEVLGYGGGEGDGGKEEEDEQATQQSAML